MTPFFYRLSQLMAQFYNADDLGVPRVKADSNQLQNILNIVFLIMGTISVLFLIINGYQYIFSAGDGQKTAKVKDALIWAGVGIAVSLFAAAIVNFVLIKLT